MMIKEELDQSRRKSINLMHFNIYEFDIVTKQSPQSLYFNSHKSTFVINFTFEESKGVSRAISKFDESRRALDPSTLDRIVDSAP